MSTGNEKVGDVKSYKRIRDHADGVEASEWPWEELAPCVQGARGAGVFNKDRQWEGESVRGVGCEEMLEYLIKTDNEKVMC